jgi:hypothetical protein
MGQERDDYDDFDLTPRWLRPGWPLGVILGASLFIGFLTLLVVVRMTR